jgi:putative aminopeptidase FrvX
MTDILPFLKELISTPGLSGYEDPAARIIEAKWQPLVHELRRDPFGSVQGLHRGTSVDPRPSILVAAHMDAIGLMVTGVVDGFLRVTNVGGVDARVLPGSEVNVYGRETLPGVVVQPPARLLPPDLQDGPVPLENLLIDVGLPARKVAELVRVGDVVAYSREPVELTGDTISGHTLDNRSSVAALTICLEELQSRPHAWDLWAVATSQEEVAGIGGAGASTFKLHPTIAIAVDVTFAKGPGANDWSTFPLGKGPTLCMGPNIHPAIHKAVQELADRLEIPYNLEYAPTNTGTDAITMQVTAEGIPTLVIGIPLRYMHTPVEVMAVKDIQRTGRLLAEFIAWLQPDFVEKIIWEN